MNQFAKAFNPEELLRASRAISQDKKTGKKDFKVYASELEQLAFHFSPFNEEEVIENIEAIIAQLEKIVKTQKEYAFEFPSQVPPSFLRYWQEKSREATENREQINQLVENEVAAWIAGQKKKYQLPEGKLTSEQLEEVKKCLEKESIMVEGRLFRNNYQILRNVTSFQKALEKELGKYFPSDVPKEEVRKGSQVVAQRAVQEVTGRLSSIENEEDFKTTLAECLLEALKSEERTAMHLPAFEKNLSQIVKNLAPHFRKNIVPAARATYQENEKILKEATTASAFNLASGEPPQEVRDQITPEAGRSLREEWGEVCEWLYTQGYPTQTAIRLAKSDYTVFKGTAKTIIKTIKEGFLPGLTLREQFLHLLAMGPRALMAKERSLTVRGWFDYLGKEKFEEEFKQLGILEPKDWQKISYELAMKLKENLREELEAVRKGEKTVSFKEREVLLTYNRLFEFIELLKQFKETHPRLTGTLHRFGQIISWPTRHPHIMLVYQLTKVGPYAPRLVTEFYTGWALTTAFKAAVVKLTEGFSWGWERKYVPLIGWKTVWKPTERLKGWVKKNLFRFGKAFLRKIGLEKLALKLAGFFSGWGTAISVLWQDIKRAGKALLAGFITTLLVWGKTAATGFAIGSLVGFGLGGFFGFKAGAALGAKIGGTIGVAVGGPFGAIIGGIIGGILGAIIGTLIALGIQKFGAVIWQTITAPFAAPATAGGLGGAGFIGQATAGLASFVTPVLVTTGATVVGGSLLLNIVTSSAFIIPTKEIEEATRKFETPNSPYIKVVKITSPSHLENDELPNQISYTIQVSATDKSITNIQIKNSTTVTTKNDVFPITQDKDGNSIVSFSTPDTLSPGDSPWEINYVIAVDGSFENSIVLDEAVVTADVPDLNLSNETSRDIARVTIGTSPIPIFECSKAGKEITVDGSGYPVTVDLLTGRGRTGQCIDPTMIVIHWSGAWSDNAATKRTLEARGLSCQFGTDQDGSIAQWLQFWEDKVELAWCIGTSDNNYALNNEMVGAFFDDNPPPEAELDSAVKSTCWLMKQYHISWTQIWGHYQLFPGKPDPGEKFLQNTFIPRVKETCPGAGE